MSSYLVCVIIVFAIFSFPSTSGSPSTGNSLFPLFMAGICGFTWDSLTQSPISFPLSNDFLLPKTCFFFTWQLLIDHMRLPVYSRLISLQIALSADLFLSLSHDYHTSNPMCKSPFLPRNTLFSSLGVLTLTLFHLWPFYFPWARSYLRLPSFGNNTRVVRVR